jgi:salicylate hydroxylase
MKLDHPVIVGGGIAGLATAWGLHTRGTPVTVLEQTPEFSAIGAGLQLGPNAVKALQALDLWQTVKTIVYSPPEIHVRDAMNGKLIQRIHLGQSFRDMFGADYGVAHRADLHRAILSAVTGSKRIDLQTGQRVESLKQTDRSIELTIVGRDSVECQMLLAADGIHSVIRQHLFPAAKAVRLPFTFFRNLLPLSVSNDDVAMDCVNLWMGRGCHIVHYPVGEPKRLNVIAVASEHSASADWSTKAQPSEVEQKFSAVHNKLKRIIFERAGWTCWSANYVSKLPQWHQGQLCLLGDAAHGTVPFLAQGGAMALEDAATAARLYNSSHDWFATFEANRKARASRLDRESRSMAATYHMGQPAAAVRNIVMKALGEQAFLSRLAWIYAFSPN